MKHKLRDEDSELVGNVGLGGFVYSQSRLGGFVLASFCLVGFQCRRQWFGSHLSILSINISFEIDEMDCARNIRGNGIRQHYYRFFKD